MGALELLIFKLFNLARDIRVLFRIGSLNLLRC